MLLFNKSIANIRETIPLKYVVRTVSLFERCELFWSSDFQIVIFMLNTGTGTVANGCGYECEVLSQAYSQTFIIGSSEKCKLQQISIKAWALMG
jgi:hypothetical protein